MIDDVVYKHFLNRVAANFGLARRDNTNLSRLAVAFGNLIAIRAHSVMTRFQHVNLNRKKSMIGEIKAR